MCPEILIAYVRVGYALDREGRGEGVLYGARGGGGVRPQDHRMRGRLKFTNQTRKKKQTKQFASLSDTVQKNDNLSYLKVKRDYLGNTFLFSSVYTPGLIKAFVNFHSSFVIMLFWGV